MDLYFLTRLFLLLGLAVGVAGGVQCVNTRNYLQAASRATGLVVDMEDSTEAQYPVVRFQTGTGETVQFTSYSHSDWDGIGPGSRVTVLYLPDDPRAHDRLLNDLWFLPVLSLALGGVLLLVSFRFHWLAVRATADAPPGETLASLLRREEEGATEAEG